MGSINLLNLIATSIITIGVGIVIISLIKYIFMRERGIMMSKEDHFIACNKAQHDVREGIKEEFKNFKEYFNTEMENKVLKSLRNLNGTLEQKIEDIVARQISNINIELTRKLEEKLNMVDIVKELIKK